MAKLFLDVDGVINAFDRDSTAWDDWTTAKATADGIAWTITWSPAMLQELDAFGMDLIWATSWMEFAPVNLANTIGFGHGKRYLVPVDGKWEYPTILWKHLAVALEVKFLKGEKFVWIDDEMSDKEIAWAYDHGGLAIKTDENHGITRADLARIEEYLL